MSCASVLALQNELDQKWMELRARYKAVLEAERARGNLEKIIVTIDSRTYILKREDDVSDPGDPVEVARKLGGFYLYRLVPLGRQVS
jgi:hypothetical protein